MKPTKAQVQLRVEEILAIRLDGAQHWDVRQFVREKEKEPKSVWELPEGGKSLSDSQLWRYMAKADALIAESCRASRKKLMHRHLAQRRHLYAKSVSAGDYRTALACIKDEAELLALFPDKLSTKQVTALAGQLAAMVCRRLPESEHAAVTAELQTIMSNLDAK